MKLETRNIYSGELDYDKFGRMLDHPTQCYKFYWLEAIMNLFVSKTTLTFDEIIDEMIVLAWYSVTQYHLFLGPIIDGKRRDAIGGCIEALLDHTNLNEFSKKEEIKKALTDNASLTIKYKKTLAKYVPYKLLTSFLDELKKDKSDAYKIDYMKDMNQIIKLPYIIENGEGLQKKVVIQEEWISFLQDNYAIIKNWIQYNKIQYLQMINPGVPGIINKLEDQTNKQRHLENVRDLWKANVSISKNGIIDIYTRDTLESNFDIDHFIPWSYVSHDEIWNLIPCNSSVNRSKSNNLPDWNSYFNPMANLEFELYENIHKYDSIHTLFNKCKVKNLQALWAIDELYIPNNTKEIFVNKLESHLHPLYESAKLQGYRQWRV